MNAIILLLFALSGLTGLVYEVVWRRMLFVVLGGSIYATAAVLSAFMGGLFLGSVVVGRWADRWRNPLRGYGLFEILIGGVALVFPLASRWLVSLQRYIYPSLGNATFVLIVLRFVGSFILLLIPTFLMGGTFPLLSKFYLRNRAPVGKGIGRLYSVNTGGAVLGTVLAGFFLVKTFGARGANLLAAGLNGAVGIAAMVVSIGRSCTPAAPASSPEIARATDTRRRRAAVLIAFAISGFTALCYEVLWTRVLVFVVGNTTYSFTIMLSTFLVGLTIGSHVFARFLARRKDMFAAVAIVEVLIGVFAVAGMALTRSYYSIFQWMKGLSSMWGHGSYTTVRYVIAAIGLLPQAVLFGMCFPAVISIYTGGYEKLGRDVGRAYGGNTLGAIFGSVAAVFVLIPAFGLAGAMLLMAVVNVAIGMAFFGLSPVLSSRSKLLSAVGGVALFACVAVAVPPRIDVGSSNEGLQGERGDLIFYREGASGTVAVFVDAEQGLKMMQIDGNPQVPTDLDALQAFYLLGHLPFFVHPDPKEVLITAFGGGITTGAILRHPVERVDAVEICSSVFEAARFFEEENAGVLKDSRLRLIVDDANNFVKATNRRYDVVASDATHPGASESWVLYTREFYSACRRLLKSGGVMCQWIPLHGLPTRDLKVILRTFQDVFPHASLWFARGYTVVLGTPDRLVINAERINNVLKSDKETFARLSQAHLESVPAVLKNLILDEEDIRRFVSDAPIATEDSSPLAFAESRATGGRLIPANVRALADTVGGGFPRVLGASEPEEKAIAAAVSLRKPYLEAVRCWHDRKSVEGLSYLEEALASGWEDADLAWYLRWFTMLAFQRYRREGDIERSLNDFRRWAEVFPRSPWTRISLGHFLIDKGRSSGDGALVEHGMEELSNAVNLAPGDPVILYEVSQSLKDLIGEYLRTEQYEKAIPLMERLAQLLPDDPLSWSTLAGAYEAAQRDADAHRAILKALELEPHNPLFQAARQRLESRLQSSPVPDEEKAEHPASSPYSAPP